VNRHSVALCSLVLGLSGSVNAGGAGGPDDGGTLDPSFGSRFYQGMLPKLPHAAPPKAGRGWLGAAGTIADSPLCREWKCRLLGTPEYSGHNNGVDYETYGFAARTDLLLYEWHSVEDVPRRPGDTRLGKIEGLTLFFKTAQLAQVQTLMPDLLRLATGLPLHYDLERNCTNADFSLESLHFSALLDKYGVNCSYDERFYEVNVFLGAGAGWGREAGDHLLSVLVGQGAAYRDARQRGEVRVFKDSNDGPSSEPWNAYTFKQVGRYVAQGQIFPFEVERWQEPGGGVFDVGFVEFGVEGVLARTMALRTSAQDQKLLGALFSDVSGQLQTFSLDRWCVPVPFALGDPRNLDQASARRFTGVSGSARPEPQELNCQRFGDEVQVIVRPVGSDMFWPAHHPFLLPAGAYP
jgi:hypothetical protein